MPLSQEFVPSLYKSWGKDGIDRINAALEQAVNITAASDQCDQVFMSGYSFDRSEPRDHFSVFVDCSNGERFYYSEADALQASAAPSSVADALAAVTDVQAFSRCEELAKEEVQHPSTMDVSWLNSNVQRGPLAITVALSFEAKNSFGAMLPYVAFCSIDATKSELMSVKER